MKNIILLTVAALSLSSCASMNQTMVHPETGYTENCSAFGIGLGAAIAYGMQTECKDRLKAAGFVESEDYKGKLATEPKTIGHIAFTSEPNAAQIYSGPDKDRVTTNKLTTTPLGIDHPQGGRMWAKECYKATKDGYFDSEVQCFEPTYGDRVVHFKLAAKP